MVQRLSSRLCHLIMAIWNEFPFFSLMFWSCDKNQLIILHSAIVIPHCCNSLNPADCVWEASSHPCMLGGEKGRAVAQCRLCTYWDKGFSLYKCSRSSSVLTSILLLETVVVLDCLFLMRTLTVHVFARALDTYVSIPINCIFLLKELNWFTSSKDLFFSTTVH